MDEERSENRDSCYYPGCRKDANCNCEICLASINATLDLMSVSVQKSSLTKLSSSKPSVKSTPILFDSSLISTPTSSSPKVLSSPALKSTGRLNRKQKTEKVEMEEKDTGKKERFLKWGLWGRFLKWSICLSLILLVRFTVFSLVFSGIHSPSLSPEIVKTLGQKSCMLRGGLNGKMRFLHEELHGILDKNIQNCSHSNSVWEINQNGLLLNSRCTLYKSSTEEVSIWGWPLQTAGLLKTGFSFRSFIVMSGRITEWPEGQVGYVIRKANTSWVQQNWAVSVVQLDPNTWILEYKRSSMFCKSRWYSAAGEFLIHRISEVFKRAKEEFPLLPAFDNFPYGQLKASQNNQIPT